MSDYNLFPGAFTVKEADIIDVLKSAIAAGLDPMLYINGMYYSVQIDNVQVAEKPIDDLPF